MLRYSTHAAMSAVVAMLLTGISANIQADNRRAATEYEVTVTNLTKDQLLSPPVAATHGKTVAFFALGEPALDELVLVAEDGMGGPLADLLNTLPEVYEAMATTDPIPPGGSITLDIVSRGRFDRLSLAGMLVNTNDAFAAVDTVALPRFRHRPVTYYASAYDAGSEENNENCDFIPGPACGGPNERDTDGAEGFVHVHNGVHGIGDLDPAQYDWRNPVAKVVIERVR